MYENKKICILGITGSIGRQTIDIAKKLNFKIVGCSYYHNHQLAKKIINNNNIKHVYCALNKNGSFNQLIKKCKPNLVVNAIVGMPGLKATLAAINNNVDIALANKESLVVAGKFIFKLAKIKKINILPIDSEHTNLYNQLMHLNTNIINSIYITCSGGSFFDWTNKQKQTINYKQATKHKNWLMGAKITIDSNTLMNKCFEIVEAYWYFKTNRINVLLDKKSHMHSAVLTNDGSFYYSCSSPNMSNAIKLALTNFKIDLRKKQQLSPTNSYYPVINNIKPICWGYDIINDKTNSLGIIINCANDVAHELFVKSKIKFNQILPLISWGIKNIKKHKIHSINEVFDFYKTIKNKIFLNWK